MKYSLPKINFSLLRSAEEYFNNGVRLFNERLLKRESDLLESLFSTLSNFFSTIGVPNLTRKMRIKEDPPRTAPNSKDYNTFLRAARLDLGGTYEDTSAISRTSKMHFNYVRSYMDSLTAVMKGIAHRVADLAVISQSVDSRDIWWKENFGNDSGIDTAYEGYSMEPGHVDSIGNKFEIGFSDSEDELIPENIAGMSVDIDKSPAFHYSEPYFGREYGVISDSGEDVHSDEHPRIDISDPDAPWNATTLYNLVDPGGVDTFWEVEVTAREEMAGITTENDTKGPCFFLRDAGEHGTISKSGANSREYRYDNGLMVYGSRAYDSSFFRDAEGGALRHPLRATITIRLKRAIMINTLSLRRKLEDQYTTSGELHTIFVTDIQTNDGTDDFSSLPSFEKPVPFRVQDGTVQAGTPIGTYYTIQQWQQAQMRAEAALTPQQRQQAQMRAAAATGDSNSSRGANRKPARARRSAIAPTVRSNPVSRGRVSEETILKPSSNQFSDRDSWTFPTRMVKNIKILLYTDSPYRIRYTVGRYKIKDEKKALGFTYDVDVHWKFVQYGRKDYTYDEQGKRSDGGGSTLERIVGMIPVVALVKGLSKIFGSSTSVEPNVHALHTLTRKVDSDMYRWSVALSDISATTYNYNELGEFISIKYFCPQEMDRIVLYANHELNGGAIDYFIIPEGGGPVRIQPFEERDERFDDGRYIPKILYVNSDMPEDRRERSKWGSAAYINTTAPLRNFRVRAVLTRGDAIRESPVIHDYRVRVIPKSAGGVVRFAT